MQRLTADGIDRPEQYRELRARVMGRRRRVLRDCLQAGVTSGELAADVDIDWLADLLAAPVLAAALTHRRLPSIAQLSFVVDAALYGVAAAPAGD